MNNTKMSVRSIGKEILGFAIGLMSMFLTSIALTAMFLNFSTLNGLPIKPYLIAGGIYLFISLLLYVTLRLAAPGLATGFLVALVISGLLFINGILGNFCRGALFYQQFDSQYNQNLIWLCKFTF